MQSRRRRVKIIATLGPASADRKTIAALFAAGADVFRINMSHASHDGMRERVAMIREVEEETGRPIGILVDLQGPKLRLGTFASGAADLQRGEAFILDGDPTPGGQARVYLPHPEILSSLAKGHRILIDDGKVMLRVAAAEGGRALTVVEVAGRVSNKKGVSLPDTTIPTSAMTDKDHADLAAALEEDIDWIALSFVQRPEDIVEVKAIVKGRALVMAKIEKPQAVQRIEEIMAVADALMVARGDLGVEMPLEQVPGIQKTLDSARAAARQAGGGGDADAGIDDLRASADARRSVGRRDRGLRGRGRRHAVGRERFGPISARGGRDHEQDRGSGGIGEDLPLDHRGAARGARGDGRRRDRRSDARCRRDARSESDLRLDQLGLDRPSHRPPAAALLDFGADAASNRWRGASLSSGACIRSSPTTRVTNATWPIGPAATPISRASPARASALSLSPACRSGPRAPPTTCASRRWDA